MQRNTQVFLGVLLLVAVGVALVVTRATRERPRSAPVAKSSASAAPSASMTPPLASSSTESAVETALSPEDDSGEAFDTMPDGGKVPPLPDSAPQSVSFGVVQFAYDGAQFAGKGSRKKEQARQRAASVIELAQKDFHAAVAKGDKGSTSNLGRIPRGILEPAVEYVLFTLPKGTVYGEPIDTPRGYWVVRRID